MKELQKLITVVNVFSPVRGEKIFKDGVPKNNNVEVP